MGIHMKYSTFNSIICKHPMKYITNSIQLAAITYNSLVIAAISYQFAGISDYFQLMTAIGVVIDCQCLFPLVFFSRHLQAMCEHQHHKPCSC